MKCEILLTKEETDKLLLAKCAEEENMEIESIHAIKEGIEVDLSTTLITNQDIIEGLERDFGMDVTDLNVESITILNGGIDGMGIRLVPKKVE